jgi:hypothetical protein
MPVFQRPHSYSFLASNTAITRLNQSAMNAAWFNIQSSYGNGAGILTVGDITVSLKNGIELKAGESKTFSLELTAGFVAPWQAALDQPMVYFALNDFAVWGSANGMLVHVTWFGKPEKP